MLWIFIKICVCQYVQRTYYQSFFIWRIGQNGKQKNATENKTCVRWIITGCRKPNWKCCFKISLSESVRILLYYSHVYEFLNKEIRNHLQLLKGLKIIPLRTVQDNSIPTRKNMHGRNNIGGFPTYKFLTPPSVGVQKKLAFYRSFPWSLPWDDQP